MEHDPQYPQPAAAPSESPGDDFPNGMLYDGQKFYSRAKLEEFQREQEERRAAYRRERREKWLETPEGKLCMEFYRKFQEYKDYLEKHPGAQMCHGSRVDFTEHQLFQEGLRVAREYERERAEKDLRNLRRARAAARCEHLHADGRRCGSPRVKGNKLCYMHQRMEEARASKLDLGLLEDAESIQLAIMKLQRAVIDGVVDGKQAGRLAYLIQLAAWNVTHTRMPRREENDFDDGEDIEPEEIGSADQRISGSSDHAPSSEGTK
jgi:hypothetical protein